MKKFLNRLISICLLAIFSLNTGFASNTALAKQKYKKKTVLRAAIKKEVKREKPKKPEFQIPLIEDEVANEIDAQSVKKIRYKELVMEDDAVKIIPENIKKQKKTYKNEIITDEEVVISKENQKYKPSDYKKQVNTEIGAEVILRPVKKIRTKNKRLAVKKGNDTEKYNVPFPSIGDRVEFRVVKDVIKNGNVIIPKNTVVYAKVGEVAPRAMGGAPAEMTLENFEMIDENGHIVSLDGEIASSGYSLSFWIGLAELATTPFLFGLAVPLLRVLPGGQAVVTPRKNYIVYY